MNRHFNKELVALVADLDAENALRELLRRFQSLSIQSLKERQNFDIYRHIQRDSGCRCEAVNFLQVFIHDYRYALVVFDHDGCGWENQSAMDIEQFVESQLNKFGWQDRCAVVVPETELEAWVWSDSPHVENELGWHEHQPSLREWLIANKFIEKESIKPADPQGVMLKALSHAGKPISSCIFSNLAKTIGLSRCQDRAFLKLKETLQKWFPSR